MPNSDLSPELANILQFVREVVPFDQLSEEELVDILPTLKISYHRKGEIFKADDASAGLRIIRSGAAELRTSDGQLLDRFGEGVSFNIAGLDSEQKGIRAILIEDALIYRLPEVDYQAVRSRYREFDRFFHGQRRRRLRRAGLQETATTEMLRQVADIMSTELLTTTAATRIQQAAIAMSERRVSSILIVDGDQLVGIVTDRDIRSRAVAKGVDLNESLTAIMSSDIQTLSRDSTLFDATLLMTQTGYHHFPVVQNGRLLGMVTASDLMLARRQDPVYLVQHIGRQKTVEGIRGLLQQLPDLLIQWVNSGVGAARVSRLLTAVSDAVTQKLIRLYCQDHGESPVPFCWLGFGSQGRGEQLLGGDQDNALLIDNQCKPEHEAWFSGLATWVCDGLNACGYVYCPGGIMATTDSWRTTLAQWQATVSGWTATPTPDAVMRVSIFFDVRAVYGEPSLVEQLQRHMLRSASQNTIFLAALAENLLATTPPLGIFRKFVVERDGEHRHELDLKKRGVIPIVDLVRIHALAHEITAVNTVDRLKQLASAKYMTIGDSRNLQDALQVILQIRVESQVRHLANGSQPDNYVNPDDLSKLSRRLLRDAFSAVADAQQTIKLRYRPGL